MNCPICNKAGLGDTISVCPQCNSDLVGFQTLKRASSKHDETQKKVVEIEKELQAKNAKNRQIMIFSTIAIFGTLLYIFWSITNSNSKIDVLTKEAKENKDSLLAVNQRFTNLVEESNHLNTIKYIVRKGDDLAKISEFYYNDYHKYKIIMKDNNLSSAIINVGDTLNIKIKKQ
jgi:LysM domain